VIKLYINQGTTTTPVLTYSDDIRANGTIIDVGGNSAPEVVDWDNDGRKDLILGTENYDVRIYLNNGTNESPTFSTFSTLSTVRHYRGYPKVFDLNDDGKKDIIIGENDGYLWYYENLNTDADPMFGTGERLQIQSGTDIKVYNGSKIDLNDWDEDGSMDLLVGDYYGYVEVYVNTEIASGLNNGADDKPTKFSLSQNYPNPFNVVTQIEYQISDAGFVELSVYNLLGEKVANLVSEQRTAGTYQVSWNAAENPSGIYIYRLTSSGFIAEHKCMLLK